MKQFHAKDTEIMKHYIRIGEGKQGYGEKMWYRRFVLWTLFLGNATEEYDQYQVYMKMKILYTFVWIA